MTNALKVIEIARKEVGTVESPPKSNKQKYGKELGCDGVFWCAIFITWVFIKAGLKIPKISFSYCPDWVIWFKEMNRYYPSTIKPLLGDVVFFAFTDEGIKNNWAEHIGFVVSVNKDGSINTLEANTSAGVGSQNNGDGVYPKIRRKPFITGYGRPFYK